MSVPPAPLPVAFRDWEKEVSPCGPGGSSSRKHNKESQSRKGSVGNHLERWQDVEDATQMGRLFTSFLFAESTV